MTVPNGSGTITGAINGYTVTTPRSVVSVVTPTSFSVYISDRADLCAILQAGGSAKSSSFLRFGAVAGAAKVWPAAAYTYPSSGGGTGGGTGGGGGGGGAGTGMHNALIATADANCTLTGYTQASAGNFTTSGAVDPASATTVDGTFDITFSVGAQSGQFKGTFKAPVCPGAKEIPLNTTNCK
ncbi:MAG: hypothetical protein JWN44_2726 [Myxococcales bacterium]|nr:hypothetical protein [Myxococcales bacterium]